MNERMLHLYSALLCIAVIMWGGGGGSLLNHHQCAVMAATVQSTKNYVMAATVQSTKNDVMAATVQRRQCAHHTPATGGEEREIEPIKWMGIRRP